MNSLEPWDQSNRLRWRIRFSEKRTCYIDNDFAMDLVKALWTVQCVQNAGAWLIFRIRRSEHITTALISLHWLRIPERISFKLAVMMHRSIYGTSPSYLQLRFTRVTDMTSRGQLWSCGWWRGSVVRASVFDWRTFRYVPDLLLTCDHFVGKASAMGQTTRPTQPPTLSAGWPLVWKTWKCQGIWNLSG